MSWLARIAPYSLGVIVAFGCFWSYSRGGQDFRVFYHAWDLVLNGRGMSIYTDSPDRFLYAPGFAWLFAPVALLPVTVALGMWNLLKASVLAYLVHAFALRLKPTLGVSALGLACLGVLMISRSLLIEFQYGQVNLLILGACVWALLGRYDGKRGRTIDAVRWGVLTVAALAKVYPLPLLLVPFFFSAGLDREKVRMERKGIFFGMLVIFCITTLTQNPEEMGMLISAWVNAVFSKGIPLETHNQSFFSLIFHYLSGQGAPVIAMSGKQIHLGGKVLSIQQIFLVGSSWFFMVMGLLVAWITTGMKRAPLRWMGVLIALLIVPSHLVWKPYFVMAIPLSIVVVTDALRAIETQRHYIRVVLVLIAFFSVNFSGFDFIGFEWAARFEATAVFLLAHLLLIAMAIRTPARTTV